MRRVWRPTPGFFLVVALVTAGAAWAIWSLGRPGPVVLVAPPLTPALERDILAAIYPGWPQRPPLLPHPDGPIAAAKGRVEGLAAADVDADGLPEWGVVYTWLGPKDATGSRATQPGFAILQGISAASPVKPGEQPAAPRLLYEAAGTGGWEKSSDGNSGSRLVVDASEVESRVEAVRLGRSEVGFLAHQTVEISRGGRASIGRSHLYAMHLGQWGVAWEGTTESRRRWGHADEDSDSTLVNVQDLDGNGTAELVLKPSHYRRHLVSGDRGIHFTADGPGDLVYQRQGATYVLAALAHSGAKTPPRLRPAPPIYAVRAPGPVVIDGLFPEWESEELTALATVHLDDPGLIKYKRQDRRGQEDCSGVVQLMWDALHLYVRAVVQDDMVVPGPPGRNLYKGDHLAVWLDLDLARDFTQASRNADDWQMGLSPGIGTGSGESYTWVPKAGRHQTQVASRSLIDPYNGAALGYQLEAAIPWSDFGGPPAGATLARPPAPPVPGLGALAPRTYHLGLAGMAGCALVLSDSDEESQELAYASNPGFVWAEPLTFNSLLLVERANLP